MYARASCILAALVATGEEETDAEQNRAFVGAFYIAEATFDVRQIRRLLTPVKG